MQGGFTTLVRAKYAPTDGEASQNPAAGGRPLGSETDESHRTRQPTGVGATTGGAGGGISRAGSHQSNTNIAAAF
jgi:hypothetical protein